MCSTTEVRGQFCQRSMFETWSKGRPHFKMAKLSEHSNQSWTFSYWVIWLTKIRGTMVLSMKQGIFDARMVMTRQFSVWLSKWNTLYFILWKRYAFSFFFLSLLMKISSILPVGVLSFTSIKFQENITFLNFSLWWKNFNLCTFYKSIFKENSRSFS